MKDASTNEELRSDLAQRRAVFEALYEKLNRREFVSPDPLQFLYAYENVADREVVGLIAALLAYGNVRQICRSVAAVIGRLDGRPARFVERHDFYDIRGRFAEFRHRFTTGEQVARVLAGVGRLRCEHGSLETCFAQYFFEEDVTVKRSLASFTKEPRAAAGGDLDGFLPSPEKGSACKRLFLFLRWMIRQDAVDPGGWRKVPKRALVIPLDTHMHRIALQLGFTQSKQSNLKTALEVTAAFREIVPEDPVRYDFVLTRFGIRKEMRGGLRSEMAVAEEEAGPWKQC